MSNVYNLIEHEIPRLRRYARALTRSADRADDLVQDTIMRAITNAHLWQAGTDLRAWLFTIMHNRHVNNVRSTAREDAMIDIDEMSSSLVATSDPTASRQLRELKRALARLPDEQREVILLVGLEEMSYQEAAQVLRVPVGTVRSRLSRGRDALRRLWTFQKNPARQVRFGCKQRNSQPSSFVRRSIGPLGSAQPHRERGRQTDQVSCLISHSRGHSRPPRTPYHSALGPGRASDGRQLF